MVGAIPIQPTCHPWAWVKIKSRSMANIGGNIKITIYILD
jgi:hypothetical protein